VKFENGRSQLLSQNRKFGRLKREDWRGFGDLIFHIAKTTAERIIGESQKRIMEISTCLAKTAFFVQ
jgi:hypothetical protein